LQTAAWRKSDRRRNINCELDQVFRELARSYHRAQGKAP
jgi:hypothetical protein